MMKLKARLREFYEAGEWGKLIALSLGLLGGVSVVITLFWIVIAMIIQHWEALVFIVGVPICMYWWWQERRLKYPAQQQVQLPAEIDTELLRQRAEEVYTYVRDAAYLVLSDVSSYTPVVQPASPSAVETNTRIYVREGVAFFQFNAVVSGPCDLREIQERLQQHLTNRSRNRELPGIPGEVVLHNGRPYSPLQVYSVTDFGSSVGIDIVFADKASIPLLEAKARARMERQRQIDYRDGDFH